MLPLVIVVDGEGVIGRWSALAGGGLLMAARFSIESIISLLARQVIDTTDLKDSLVFLIVRSSLKKNFVASKTLTEGNKTLK
jgi:hypothetical protein